MAITITLLIWLALIAGSIVLQIHLSKKESKWPGLIMPIIFFCISIIFVLGYLLSTPVSMITTSMSVDTDGTIIEATGDVQTLVPPSMIIASTIFTFLIINIPTLVLMLIYIACRGKRNKQRALEKMSIQDLE
jgi:hypothetical protein